VRKEELSPDEWLRDLSPSDELRHWFGHDPTRWSEFRSRYRRELAHGPAREALRHLVERAQVGPVTLLYGARDEEHNNAVVLQEMIEARLRRARSPQAAQRRDPCRLQAGAGGHE
jgi:uncharacterized protein YeaO (DUF488 family)